jgi:hypothetical protein
MSTEIVLIILVMLLLGVIGAQSYFLFRLSQTVSVLRAAPDAEAARLLLRSVEPKKKPQEEKQKEPEVSPADFGPEAIAALRKKQDANH